jgi:hypothetical protein
MSRTLSAVRLRRPVLVLVAAVLATGVGLAGPAHAETPSERKPTPTLPAGPSEAPAPESPAAAPGSDAQAAAEAATDASRTRTVSAVVRNAEGAEVISVDAAPSDVPRAMAELRQRPGVVAVAVDTPVWADAVDPMRWEQWGLDAMNMDLIAPGTADDSALKIAVVDSGVLATHEDLAGKVLCDLGSDFVADPVNGTGSGCIDPRGHGTHVAGEIAAISDNGLGIAGVSNAAIIPVRVLNENGWGTGDAVAAGIIRAVDTGASVINLSLGGPGSAVKDAALDYALDHNVVVVASAGNDRQSGNAPHFPAGYPGVISVAASDDTGLSTYYSNNNAATNVLVTAPGHRIASTSAAGPQEYGYMNGTSMSTPYVTGVLSRYRALHPTATVADVRAAVQATAEDMERPGRDASTGYGMIDALELLTGQDAPALPAVPTPGAATVTAAAAGSGAVSVRWAAPDYSGTSAITAYDLDVYRWNPSTTDWDYLSTTTVGAGARSATLSGLRNGYAHSVVIWAWNAAGYGQYAETDLLTPLAPTRPGVPGVGTISPVAGGAVVRWSAAPNNRSAIRSYTVRAYRGTKLVRTVTAGGNATSVSVPGLANGAGHTFTVTATNGVGAGPASARSAVVVPRTKPTAPRILGPVAGAGAATVRWAAPTSNGGAAITGYTVRAYRGTALVTTVTAARTATSVTVPGLLNGHAHTFAVYATNAAGTSPLSARSGAVVPRAVPGAPVLGTVSPGNGSAVIRWAGPSSNGGSPVRNYVVRVYRDGTQVKSATLAATARAATVTGLANGVTHTVTVTATNALGAGPASATGTVVPRTVPGAPTGVVVTPGAGSGAVTVQWAAPASNGGSTITSYMVQAYRGATLVKSISYVLFTDTTLVFDGLTNGVAYTFTVSASNAAGSGPTSARTAPVTPLA